MRLHHKIKKAAHGSLTVEAALVLPIFIYAIVAFLYFLQIIYVHEILQNAITETGFFSVKYAYVYDYIMDIEDKKETEEDDIKNKKNSAEAVLAHGIDSTYYKIKMQDYLNTDLIDNSCIENGFDGIHTYLSSYMTEEDSIDIILVYNIKLPLLFFNLSEIPMSQRVRMRGWSGHKVEPKDKGDESEDDSSDSEEEEIVYITETGSVYHLTKFCTYLNLSIKQVEYGDIESLRNESGGKYKTCELCGDSENPTNTSTVYITDSGDRYHLNLNCSGLKRTIIEIPLSEVDGRTLCSRCKSK